MTATDELRRLLDERGIVWMDVRRPTFLRTCWKTGDADVYCYFDEEKSTGVFGLSISGYDFTPEQAIAATLGCEPNEIELIQTYDAGFRNGVMAVFQQLEGIEDYEGLQDLIAEYWGEGEGNDER